MQVRAFLVAAMLPLVASAQSDRTGFSFVAGVGSGAFEFTRADLTDRRIVSQAFMVRVTHANSPHIAIGFELDHWFTSEAIKPAFTWYNAVILGYPLARGPLAGVHAKATAGIQRYRNRVFSSTELGWGGGLGFERGIARGVAVSAYADYLVAAKANVTSYMQVSTGNVVQINTRTGGSMFVYGLGLKLH